MIISIANSEWSKQKVKNFKKKFKSFQPKRKTAEVKHFHNLLGNAPEIMDKPIRKIIYSIKLQNLMMEELDSAGPKKEKKLKAESW